MSKALNLDPKKGFLSLPKSILELEMSPGAFRALAFLCNYADEKGWCYPSFEQIGAVMNRGKAAISGYIEELRELGLVVTKKQRYASGYNFRLKFRVTFWKAWWDNLETVREERKAEASSSKKKSEHSNRSSERHTSYKHKTIETHTTARDASKHGPSKRGEPKQSVSQPPAPAATEVVVKKIYEEWVECTRGAPFGQFSRPASPDLIRRSEEVLVLHPIKQDEAVSSAAISERLSATWQDLGVDCPPETLNTQVEALLARNCSGQGLDNLTSWIRDIWKHFWKYPPAPRQFEELIAASAGAIKQQSQLRVIKSRLNSWRLANQQLDQRVTCDIIC